MKIIIQSYINAIELDSLGLCWYFSDNAKTLLQPTFMTHTHVNTLFIKKTIIIISINIIHDCKHRPPLGRTHGRFTSSCSADHRRSGNMPANERYRYIARWVICTTSVIPLRTDFRLYRDAAGILNLMEKRTGSLRSLVFSQRTSSKKQAVYALVHKTLSSR